MIRYGILEMQFAFCTLTYIGLKKMKIERNEKIVTSQIIPA